MRPRRTWFVHPDGGYYRNIPLNFADRDRLPWWRFRAHAWFDCEFYRIWNKGMLHVDEVPHGDRLAEPEPLHASYPELAELCEELRRQSA